MLTSETKCRKCKPIILGVFQTKEFQFMRKEYGWSALMDWEEDFGIDIHKKDTTFIEILQEALAIAPEVNFLMDGLTFPLFHIYYSFTSQEVEHILKSEYLQKVKFWKDLKPLNTQAVQETYYSLGTYQFDYTYDNIRNQMPQVR